MSLIKEVLRHLPELPINEAKLFQTNISITLRPHHVLLKDVGDALTRRQSAFLIAEGSSSVHTQELQVVGVIYQVIG